MQYRKLHKWNVGISKAIHTQNILSRRIILYNGFDSIKNIAGCDVAYSVSSKTAYAAICIYRFPELVKIRQITCESEISFPYISGLLAFREGPALLKAFEKLNERPDLVIFNGQGIAHPRQMGLATHMGILLDVPSIGCTQRALFGKYQIPGTKKGSWSEVCNSDQEVVGVCLRTRENTRPVFVSQGYKIGLKTAVEMIIKCTFKYKLPEPLRAAHILANSMKR